MRGGEGGGGGCGRANARAGRRWCQRVRAAAWEDMRSARNPREVAARELVLYAGARRASYRAVATEDHAC